MEFIKIAYLVSVPVWVLFSLLGSGAWKKSSINLLAVTNLLLIGHSVFFSRQLFAIYRITSSFFSKQRPEYNGDATVVIHALLVVALPLLFLHPALRRNRLFTLAVWFVLYGFFPLSTWNTYDLILKIPAYLCLLCAAYALFWLWNKLPYQSPVR